jgi:hypothetical protein
VSLEDREIGNYFSRHPYLVGTKWTILSVSKNQRISPQDPAYWCDASSLGNTVRFSVFFALVQLGIWGPPYLYSQKQLEMK